MWLELITGLRLNWDELLYFLEFLKHQGAKEEFHIWNAEAQAIAAKKVVVAEPKTTRKRSKKEHNVTIAHNEEQKIVPKIVNEQNIQKNTKESPVKKQKRNVEHQVKL